VNESYLVNTGKNHVLTPRGENFAKAGGFAGQRERAEKEEAIKQEDRERARQVNQSVLDTNNSVQRTHVFQKKITWVTILVAVCGVLIAFFGCRGPEPFPHQGQNVSPT
jgi:hypothetical protein